MGRRGHDRERAVKARLQEEDWVVIRAAGSLGGIDLVALKPGRRPLLVEVKSTAGGPYEHFRREEREALLLAADMAGGDAVLAWWPPRGELRWISPVEWPPLSRLAA